MLAASPEDATKTPSPGQLDAWLRIEKDGTVRVFTGKVEIGMGVETGFAQIVAEELDVAPQRVQFVMGDTSTTTDQGGVGGSTSISAWRQTPAKRCRDRAIFALAARCAASRRAGRSASSARRNRKRSGKRWLRASRMEIWPEPAT